jgi:spoIIIJ-associated protein
MLDKNDIQKIKETAAEFFQKTTITVSAIDASGTGGDVVDINIKLDEPQILIGEKGQTLFEIQRLLRMILNKRLQQIFYLNLDINDYKRKKVEYLKNLARELADEVSLTKETKEFFPMSAYERRIIHAELAQRPEVITESHGDGLSRHVVIKPR